MPNSVSGKYPLVKTLTNQERISMVRDIFSTITGKYDFLNHLMSLRRDIVWRRCAVEKMKLSRTGKFLDVACGTAELAIAAALYYPAIQVTGIDFVPEMVQAGKDKVARRGLTDRVTLLEGDALKLPFADNTYAVTAIAFGIRNIPDRERALKEMLRVTVPGGQVMVLEMTFVRNRFFKFLYHVYLNRLLPLFAKIFSTNPAAYYYLADSIMNFPSPAALAGLMQGSGIKDVKIHSLTFGITYLHIGEKP